MSKLFSPKMKQHLNSPKQSDVLDLYNKVGGDYIPSMFTNNSWTRFVDNKEKQVVTEYIISSGVTNARCNILDLGMGPGRWSNFFLEMGFKKVYGLDISPEMVKSAIVNIQKKNFYPKTGSIERIPFKKDYFDVVFCFRALKYVDSPNKGLQDMARVMKPNAKLILEVSNKSLLNIIFKSISDLVLIIYPKITLESRFRYFQRANFYSEEEMEFLFVKNNFKILKYSPLFVLPSIPLPVNRLSLRLLQVLDSFLLIILPKKWFARSWVFLVKREVSKF